MGFLKSLFGKSDEDSQTGLSADAVQKKIAEHNHEIEQLKRKLPSASATESMAKSAAWMAEMQAKIKVADGKGQVDEVIRLESEIKEATKKTGRIEKHVEEIKEQILQHEDAIELLERSLPKGK
jgi:wobble nucleotide-excising tRNase